MNENTKASIYKQARRQAVWAGIWLAVVVSAMIARPQTDGAGLWITEQALILAGMLMLFQFGRMFQGVSLIRAIVASPQQPNWASLEEGEKTSDNRSAATPSFSSRDIRAFANLDEAKEHGWEFAEPVAHFAGQDVPRVAKFQGKSYKYDGLYPERLMGSVPQDQRVFGKLLYRLIENDPVPPAPSPPLPLAIS